MSHFCLLAYCLAEVPCKTSVLENKIIIHSLVSWLVKSVNAQIFYTVVVDLCKNVV